MCLLPRLLSRFLRTGDEDASVGIEKKELVIRSSRWDL
jgi:hypothetical protein